MKNETIIKEVSDKLMIYVWDVLGLILVVGLIASLINLLMTGKL